MRDPNHRNEFAWKGENTGRFYIINYMEAWLRLNRGEEVYERVMPERRCTPAEKARIPWTLVNLDAEEK